MVWKQDLAQLKRQLKPDPEPTGPPPKPILPPLPSQTLEDADLLFLRAMGGAAGSLAPATNDLLKETNGASSPIAANPPNSNIASKALSIEESNQDFSEALGDLKGLRPLAKNPVFSAPGPSVVLLQAMAIPQSPGFQAQFPASTPTWDESAAAQLSALESEAADIPIAQQEVPHLRSGPVLMHLAAGMAIEVDGTLDLRRHTLNDAKDRLTERIRDGIALRWRTMLVTLGPNEALKQGFLAFLTTPQAQFISRYAQAPIPMGGAQAWVLYLNLPVPPIRKEEA